MGSPIWDPKSASSSWRVPNPPGANPLVAERAPWRSSQSCVTEGQQPLGNPHRFLSHFFCTPGNPCATPIVTRGEGSFSYQGVSTRGVRHSPVQTHKFSRLSFPATGPPDPGTDFDFKAPGSLTHHRLRHLLEKFLKGS